MKDFQILRLRDKLGKRSLASGEIRLEGAEAILVRERGRGFQLMVDMINNSRLSNGVRSAGLMRRAATEALFIASRRRTFGGACANCRSWAVSSQRSSWPPSRRTMVFLTSDVLHRANGGDATAARLARILTPPIKFRACRDTRRVTGYAMEVRGGCGYIGMVGR